MSKPQSLSFSLQEHLNVSLITPVCSALSAMWTGSVGAGALTGPTSTSPASMTPSAQRASSVSSDTVEILGKRETIAKGTNNAGGTLQS